jgi:periplasmic protein TonB
VNRSTPFAAILESQPPWWRLGGGGICVVVAYLGLLFAALSLGGRPASVATPQKPPKLVVALLDRLPPVEDPSQVSASGQGSAAAVDAVAPEVREVRAAAVKPVRPQLQRKTSETRTETPAAASPQVQPTQTAAVVTQPPDSASVEAKPAAPASFGTGAAVASGARPSSAAASGNGGSVQGAAAGSARTGTEVLPFMDGMTRPKLLEMVEPAYTREARDAKVQGLFLAKCVITTSGMLQKCRVVKGLPMMDQAVLTALSRWRYTPVIYQGKAVAVDYVVQVRLAGP